MKKIILGIVACFFLCMQLSAQTLTDGAAIWTYTGDITGAACSGNINFDAGNGIDQAFSADWYYAIGADGLSVNFPPPSAANVTVTGGNTLVAFYPNLGGIAGLNATLTIILTEIGTLNVQAAQLMQIDNNTGGDIDIKLFNYLDLDKNNATTENAVLELQDECNLITAVTNINDASQICYFAVNAADGYEIDSYPNLCNKLDDGATGLSNSGLPLLASDYTQAYQFDGTVPVGGSLTGETLVAFGEIPEAAVVDQATGQCTFPSTPAPEFTVGQPVQDCDGDSFTLTFAFDGEGTGTQYTFTEMTQAGVAPVTITDDGTVTEVTLGVYPYDASWNVSVVGDFPGGAMPMFTGDSECPPPFDCQDLMADFGDACDDGDATTINDMVTQACVCAGVTVPGCTDATACNFNAAATVDDGSCNPVDCEGNCNGNNTGSAVAGAACNDGDSTTENDVYDVNCNCIGELIEGCTDVAACNYNPNAAIDDGSCNPADCEGNCTGGDTGPAVAGTACDDGDATTVGDMYDTNCNCAGVTVPGCIDATACNYDAAATVDDGSCLYLDCEGVCGGTTLEGSACDDGDATTVGDMYDANCNCMGDQIPGCTDATACNYDNTATVNDGSCLYLDCVGVCGGTTLEGSTCDDGDATTVGDVYDATCNCAGEIVLGCLDAGACNYDAMATVDDGSCLYLDCLGVCGGSAVVGSTCDDGDACTVNDLYGADCNCAGTFADADGDTVCDAEDMCPGFDDLLNGTACDDGDACTINDTYVDCACVGTFEDTDGDGICNNDDSCPDLDNALIGTACDDGDVNTEEDVYTEACVCEGTPICMGQLDTLELGREGALSASNTGVPTDGGLEIYTWYDASTDAIVAIFIGNPYYSPSALGSYYVVVTHPDYDCFQVLGPRAITELNGCCELDD